MVYICRLYFKPIFLFPESWYQFPDITGRVEADALKNINQAFAGIDARQQSAGDQHLEHGNHGNIVCIVCAFFRPTESSKPERISPPCYSVESTEGTSPSTPGRRSRQLQLQPPQIPACRFPAPGSSTFDSE